MATQPDDASPDGRFPEHVVRAVVEHMNEDHAADTAIIARAFGGPSQVDTAEVRDVDTEGLDIAVQVGGATETIRVRFAAPVTQRLALREEVTRLYHAAVAKLGTSEPG